MGDGIDFSKLERISPKKDSWTKVCARLDLIEKAKIIRFRIYSAIPIAASFLFVGLGIFIGYISDIELNPVSIQQISSSELSNWYGSLGRSENDDLETLDESTILTYLLKEE